MDLEVNNQPRSRPWFWLDFCIALGLLGGLSLLSLYWFSQQRVRRLVLEVQQEAAAAEQSQQWDVAVARLTQSIGMTPQAVEAYPRLIKLLERLERNEEAGYWTERFVQSNPASAQAHLLRGQREAAQGRWQSAEQEAARALELAPNQTDGLLLQSQCHLTAQRWPEARESAELALLRDSGLVEAHLILARVALTTAPRAEAIRVLHIGVTSCAQQPRLLTSLAALELDEGRLADAEKTIAAIAELTPPPAAANYLEARLAYAQGRWAVARRCLEQAREQFALDAETRKRISLWLGDCYGRVADVEHQVKAYEAAVALDPHWPPPRLAIAAAYLTAGRCEESLQAYQVAATLSDLPRVFWIDFARARLFTTLGQEATQRDWPAVEQAVQRAAEADPDSLLLALLRAEVRMAQQRVPEAEQILTELRDRDRKQIAPWLALAALAERQDQPDRVALILAEAELEAGDSVPLRLAQADRLARLPQDVISELYPLAEGSEDFSERDRITLWRELAARSLAAGDGAQAIRLYSLVAKRLPSDLLAQQQLFEVGIAQQNELVWGQGLEGVKRIDRDGPTWNCNRAASLLLVGGPGPKRPEVYQQALDHLERARAFQPRWARIPLLMALIAERQGNVDKALQQYETALDLGTPAVPVTRRLVQLLCERQRYADVQRILRRLEQTRTEQADLNHLVAAALLRLGEDSLATEYVQRRPAGTKNPWEQMWLGATLTAAATLARSDQRVAEGDGYWRDAERALRRAVELAEASPEPRVALVQFLAAAQRQGDAERELAAIQAALGEGFPPLALAQCWEALGKTSEAGPGYAAALASHPDDPTILGLAADFFIRSDQAAEAESLLVKLVTGQVPASREQVHWARRNLARVTAARADLRSQRLALALVDRNLAEPPAALDDLRVKAALLAAYPARHLQREAIGLLEQLVKAQQKPPAEDEFALAQLYAAEGDRERGDQQIRRLTRLHEGNSRFLLAQVQWALERQQTDEAAAWLPRLETLLPGQFAVVKGRAQLCLQQGDTEQAIATLRGFLKGVAVHSADWDARVELVLASLEAFAHAAAVGKPAQPATTLVAAAEELWRERTAADGAQEVRRAEFLARQNRVLEALALVEKSWSQASPETVAQALSAILERDLGNRQYLHALEGLLTAAIAKHGRQGELLHALGNVYAAAERSDDAIELYWEVYDGNDQAVETLNNLAFLLALEHQDLDRALALINRAIDIVGPAPALLDTRSQVHLARRNYPEALADVEAALADAGIPARYLHQALIYRASGQEAAARKSLEQGEAAGLEISRLHPLERASYRKMRATRPSPKGATTGVS